MCSVTVIEFDSCTVAIKVQAPSLQCPLTYCTHHAHAPMHWFQHAFEFIHEDFLCPAAPTTPTGVMITFSSTTLTITWDDDGFNYRLYVRKSDSAVTTTPGPLSPPYSITGLESNTQYTVVVEAYNPLGSINATRTVWTLLEGKYGVIELAF